MHNMSWKFSSNSNFYFYMIKYETDIVHNILSFVLECLMSLNIACVQLSIITINITMNIEQTFYLAPFNIV